MFRLTFSMTACILAIILCSPSANAQLPVKDLAKGNIFYYFFRTSSTQLGYFFEKVIGDTVIQGRNYAKVYSDPWWVTATLKNRVPRSNDTLRFERSNDSALYEWVPRENKEYTRLRHIPAYKAKDTFYLKTPILDCSQGCIVGLDLRVLIKDLDGNPVRWEFISQVGFDVFVIGYGLNIANIDMSNRADNQTRRDFNLVGIFRNNEIRANSGTTINFIQQLDTILQTKRIAVGVREQEVSLNSLEVFPNPSGGEATLRFVADKEQYIRIHLYDVLGRPVSTVFEGHAKQGTLQFTVGMHNLADGVYSLRLLSDKGMRTIPITVHK